MRHLFPILLLTAFLAGCPVPTGTRPMLPVEQDITIDTIARYDAWAAENGRPPVSDFCYGQIMDLGVFVAHTQAEMVAITGFCGPSPAMGELDPEFDDGAECPNGPGAVEIWGQARSGYLEHWRIIVIVNIADWCITFPHEVLHLLLACMSTDEGGLGDGNPEHSLPVWDALHLNDGDDVAGRGPEFPPFEGCGF